MKRVVVSGASGFVGSNVARRLLREGHDVHVLLRPGSPTWRLDDVLPDLRVHATDVADRDEVTRAIDRIRPEWVFHLAVHGAYSWQTGSEQIVRTNLLGTMNVVEACAGTGVEVVVNTGSSSEYGYKDHAPTERELLEPNSYYAVSKAAGTLFCQFAAPKTGMRIPTLRLYSVYGPYEEPRRLVPALIVNGLRSHLPPLANPDTARDYVHVDDVVEAYLRAASHPIEDPGAVFNVGTGVQTTLREIVSATRTLLSVIEEPTWGSLPDRAWDTAIWRADPTRIQSELGWSARHDIEAGLAQTVAWFRESPLRTAIYERQLG